MHDRTKENGLRYTRHAQKRKSKGFALHSTMPKIMLSLTFVLRGAQHKGFLLPSSR